MEANSLYGRPWADVARFSSFEDADKKRKQLLEDKTVQVKVKKSQDLFIVKVRSTTLEEEQKSDKSSKNQRKK